MKATGVDPDDLSDWPSDFRAELEATWETIFDPAWYGRTAYWQATGHELRAEDIVEAARFEN